MDKDTQIKEEIRPTENDLKYYRNLYWEAMDEINVLKRTCKAQAELISVLLKEQSRQ